jgi:hypothetical protein
MRTPRLMLILGLALAIVSCQKEITDGTPEQPGGGTGGSSNGNRLVKLQQISTGGSDTNIITLKWDAAGRLWEYQSDGVVNTVATDILVKISRAADGKVNSIISKSTLSMFDSSISKVYYVPGSGKLSYSTTTQYSTIFGDILDSSIYTYNGAGKLVTKESFMDFFGTMIPSTKQQYEFDGNGNVSKITDLSHDGTSYNEEATTINTYNGHKAAVTYGEEESFVHFGAMMTSVNYLDKQVTNAVSSGTTYTSIFSGSTYNSFDRPIKSTITTNPNGLVGNVTYFYQ